MPIRFATLTDVRHLVEGGKKMHALTRFKNQPYIDARVTKAFSDLISQGEGKYVFFVAENADKQIVGALIGVLEQQIFSDLITASVMHFDVLPEARMGGWGVRLLKAFEQWAKNRNVFEIAMGVNSGAHAQNVGLFLKKMGYVSVGENFVRVV
jgi:GNAT superfamily N-acetyltransferase